MLGGGRNNFPDVGTLTKRSITNKLANIVILIFPIICKGLLLTPKGFSILRISREDFQHFLGLN